MRCRPAVPHRYPAAVVNRTLVICKPDAVERGLTGEIIARLERKGLRLVAAELRTDRPDHRRPPLRRARGQGVLRGPAGLHHPVAGDVAGGRGAGGHLADRAHHDGRHQPGASPRPGRSGATWPSRPPRTWCTAPTAPSRPSARSPSSFPTWPTRPRPAAPGRPGHDSEPATTAGGRSRRVDAIGGGG